MNQFDPSLITVIVAHIAAKTLVAAPSIVPAVVATVTLLLPPFLRFTMNMRPVLVTGVGSVTEKAPPVESARII